VGGKAAARIRSPDNGGRLGFADRRRIYGAMNLPIVHHPDYDAHFPANHRFPMGKYSALMRHLRARGLVGNGNLHQPALAHREWLALAHDGSYVDQVIASQVPERIEREIGFKVDERVSLRARLASAGTLLAARLALESGLACNAAGGSHHARREQGAGFCTLNDVGVAANVLLASGEIGSALVVDCDVHQGDGTADIFKSETRVFTFSMHCGKNYPVRKKASDLDLELPVGTNGATYLSALRDALPAALDRIRPDVVFYNAGVDVHHDDRLGKLKLTNADIAERDRAVIGFFRARDIAVCGVIGGGYSFDLDALAARHALLFEAAADFTS
jgi:acetoin utilization deacetylase AcuC-like enzyme